MPRLASVDGRIQALEQASIPIDDDALLRGDGVFEVMRLYDGRPFGFAEHMGRMERSAAALRLPFDRRRMEADIAALLKADGSRAGTVRALVTRGGRYLAIVEDLPEIGATLALAFVTYSPTRVLDGVKSLSYAANMLASRLAREQGADEALLVTPHGRVLEAPTAAFFWVRDGRTFTPPLTDHLLDSITRRLVIEVTGAREAVTTRDDVLGADEAYLASTTREVMPVHAIEGRPLAPGETTTAAAAAVSRRIRELLAGAG